MFILLTTLYQLAFYPLKRSGRFFSSKLSDCAVPHNPSLDWYSRCAVFEPFSSLFKKPAFVLLSR